MSRLTVPVVAGILYNRDGEFLLSSRPAGKPYAGYWEFAGGKVEAGEDDLSALAREWQEELGIRILHATPWLTRIHDYEHARVRLRFYRIAADGWQGQPQAHEGQGWRWQRPGHFDVAPMLPANTHLLGILSMPNELSGSLKTGLNAPNGYRILPYPSDNPAANIMISLESLKPLNRLPAAAHLWVIVQNTTQFQAAQDADGIIWQIHNAEAAQQVTQLLQQGAALPIAIYAPHHLCARYANAWLNAGAQAIIENRDTSNA